MHEELEAMDGQIVQCMFQSGNILFDVYIGIDKIGFYEFMWDCEGEIIFKFQATYKNQRQGGFSCERAAVDWLIGQYFLTRSAT